MHLSHCNICSVYRVRRIWTLPDASLFAFTLYFLAPFSAAAANGVHPQPHRSLLYWCKSNRDPHTLISSLYHSLRDNRVSFDVIYVCCPHTIHRAVAAATAAEDLLHAEALARVWRSVLEEEKHSSVFGQPAPTVAVFDSPLQALDRLFASLSVGQVLV